MLISESQLRAIIREELIREHQELLTENFWKNLKNNLPKVAIGLAMVANAACNPILSGIGSEPTSYEISVGLANPKAFDANAAERKLGIAPTENELQRVVDESGFNEKYNCIQLVNAKIEDVKKTIEILEKSGKDDLLKKFQTVLKDLNNALKALKSSPFPDKKENEIGGANKSVEQAQKLLANHLKILGLKDN